MAIDCNSSKDLISLLKKGCLIIRKAARPTKTFLVAETQKLCFIRLSQYRRATSVCSFAAQQIPQLVCMGITIENNHVQGKLIAHIRN